MNYLSRAETISLYLFDFGAQSDVALITLHIYAVQVQHNASTVRFSEPLMDTHLPHELGVPRKNETHMVR